MEEINFKFTPQEAAVICAELSLSLADGRCSDQEDRDRLVSIMNKLASPFGFNPEQIQSLTQRICGINLG